MTYVGLILSRYTHIILEIQTHVPYSFHGFLASFLQLFGRGVDSLIENSKYLVSLVREVVAGSQGCKTTHLEVGREVKLALSLSISPSLPLSFSPPPLSISLSFSPSPFLSLPPSLPSLSLSLPLSPPPSSSFPPSLPLTLRGTRAATLLR